MKLLICLLLMAISAEGNAPEIPPLNVTTVVLTIIGGLLVAVYALWDIGADRVVISFGRLVMLMITFGRIRIARHQDEGKAMAISVATLIVLFVLVLIIATWVA